MSEEQMVEQTESDVSSESTDGGLDAAIQKAVEEATARLKAKNHELLGDLKKLKVRVRETPDDFDPEEYKRLKADADTRAEEEAKRAGQWDKLKGDLVSRHEKTVSELNSQLSSKTKELEDYIVTSSAIGEIAKADGVPELLLPHVRNALKLENEGGKYVVRVVDGDGSARVGGNNGEYMTVAQLLAEMKQSDIFAPAFRGSRATGGGAAGAGRGANGATKNPWKKGPDFNLTEQGRILEQDPTLAARLRSEAGR